MRTDRKRPFNFNQQLVSASVFRRRTWGEIHAELLERITQMEKKIVIKKKNVGGILKKKTLEF